MVDVHARLEYLISYCFQEKGGLNSADVSLKWERQMDDVIRSVEIWRDF